MSAVPTRRLCLVARIPGLAGPASFQRRLTAGLPRRGIEICYSLDDHPYDAVLLSGGTRQLRKLAKAHRERIPIVQRLDGMNWMHRRRWTGARHFLRAEVNNLLMRWVRSRWADVVVYQSHFVQGWWEAAAGPVDAPAQVVYNGVPLDVFLPGPGDRRTRPRMLVFEARLAGGYEIGLVHAVGLARALAVKLDVELAVAGEVSAALRRRADALLGKAITWLGAVAPEDAPGVMREAEVLFSADLHPACPNAVLESMASGTPVVAFATGALPELVQEEAGRLTPYGADAWRLAPPDLPALAAATESVLNDLARYRAGARRRAEQAFGLDRMVDGYLGALGWAGR